MANVLTKDWADALGGYQVVKKWLSYREKPALGRNLNPEEVAYVSETVRRIAAILLLARNWTPTTRPRRGTPCRGRRDGL